MDRFQKQIETFSGKTVEQRKEWYSGSAIAYDRVRPRYPPPLLERLAVLTRITQNSEILEVGCGPGTATSDFASLGCRIVALEPNPEFCALARKNCSHFPNVSIVNASFEDWSSEGTNFDFVLSASAFHWIPSKIGYPKVATLLRSTGRLILLWNKELQPDFKIHQRLRKVYQRFPPTLGQYETFDEQVSALKALGEAAITSGLFTDLATDIERFTLNYSGEEYVDLLGTYSKFIQLDPNSRGPLLEKIRDFIRLELDDRIDLAGVAAAHISKPVQNQ